MPLAMRGASATDRFELVVEVPGVRRVTAEAVVPPTRTGRRAVPVILAHGAGTDRTHPSLCGIRDGLVAAGWPTVLFNFPYREAGRRAPDTRPILERTWHAILGAVRAEARLGRAAPVIGGRSMGGRIATHVAADGAHTAGLVLLGFPLHPAGRPGTDRAAHLGRVTAPMLFVQGTRDALADPALLVGVLRALPRASVHWLPDADHGFRVTRRAGRTNEQIRAEAVAATVAWLDALAD